jgi:hypothetical protein
MATQPRRIVSPWVVIVTVLLMVVALEIHQERDAAAAGGGVQTRMVAMVKTSRKSVAGAGFTAGSMTAVMGTCVLDLRRATIQPGEEAVIDLLGVMGRLTIRVPDGWVVDTMAVPVLGGLSDERRPSAMDRASSDLPRPKLILRGAVMFGGVVITS